MTARIFSLQKFVVGLFLLGLMGIDAPWLKVDHIHKPQSSPLSDVLQIYISGTDGFLLLLLVLLLLRRL